MKKKNTLIKFGQKTHMISFLENGTMYFNPLKYFKSVDESTGIGDKLEDITQIHNHFSCSCEMIPLDKSRPSFTLENVPKIQALIDGGSGGNIFCLYQTVITLGDNVGDLSVTINEDIKKFGYDSAVIIHDTDTFLKRVKSEYENRNYSGECGTVKYYDKDKVSKMNLSPFDKSDIYRYQNEYRLFIDEVSPDPIIINIGNISDIAVMKCF